MCFGVNLHITIASIGQSSTVTFCAKARTKAANKTLRAEAGVMHQRKSRARSR